MMMDCPYKDCTNKNNCLLCIPQGRLYKTKNKKPKKTKKTDEFGKVKKFQKEGMSFQKKVKDRYNKITNNKYKAYETPNSGAFWGIPGDISTEEMLMECKERGTHRGGEKYITITKMMLDKIEKEAGVKKFAGLPFGFKGDDKIYIAADFDVWLAMVQINQHLKHENEELKRKLGDDLNA